MRRHLAVVACALVMTFVAGAAAQPGNTPVTYAPPPPQRVAGERSPGVATALSLGGTAASIAALAIASKEDNDALGTAGALGLFFAPSFGHWYAGDGWTPGLTMRVAGTGATFLGGLMALSCVLGNDECPETAIVVLVYGGLGVFTVGAVYDIATAPRAAREHNARIEGRLRDVAVSPTFGDGRAGLTLSGRF